MNYVTTVTWIMPYYGVPKLLAFFFFFFSPDLARKSSPLTAQDTPKHCSWASGEFRLACWVEDTETMGDIQDSRNMQY